MIATAHFGQFDARLAGLQPRTSYSVLLISCDETENDLLFAFMEGMFRLFPARDEQRLFAVLESHTIDVIIINTGPGDPGDGIGLCERLKSAPQSVHLPVIVMIPRYCPEVRISCLRAGADACMDRPLSGDHLNAQVRNLLANRDRLKTYFRQLCPVGPETSVPAASAHSFERRLNEFILANLHDANLHVDSLAQMMNISRPTLYRKIRYVLQQTPQRLVNSIRLNKAAELLSTGEFKIFEIARMVGFRTRSNFGKAFVRHFGFTPKEYVQLTLKRRKH